MTPLLQYYSFFFNFKNMSIYSFFLLKITLNCCNLMYTLSNNMTLKKIAMEKLRKTKGFNILSISVSIIYVYVKLHLYFLMRYSLNVKREVLNINSVFESSIIVYYYLKIVIWKIARVSVNCWYIIHSMQVWHLSFRHSPFMFCNVMNYFEDRRAHYVESYGKRFI